MQSLSLRFSETVRILSGVARQHGLQPPAVRSPPADPTCDRSIRRRDTGVTLAVRLSDRPFPAVCADLVDGYLTVNGVTGHAAEEVRRDMWAALAKVGIVPE